MLQSTLGRGGRTTLGASVLLFLLAWYLFLVPAPVAAQRGEMVSIAVLPFENRSGKFPGQARGRQAADAVALELEGTRQYEVASGEELMSMIEAQGLRLPLDRPDMARVGERLGVEMLCVGIVHDIEVMQKQGRAHVRMDVRLMDVAVEEFVNGAKVSVTTARRRYLRDTPEDILIGSAFTQAAQMAVDRIVSQKVPEGTVLIVDDFGKATLSLGVQEGVKEGHVLVTLRPMWVPERELLLLRKVGTMNVINANPHVSTAERRTGQIPKRGDLFRTLYTPRGMKKRTASKKRQTYAGWLLGALAAGALGLMASGESVGDQPRGGSAWLHQANDGGTPGILVNLAKPKFETRVIGYVVYRGEFRDFQPDAGGVNIEAVLNGQQNRSWIDAPPSDLAVGTVTVGPVTFIVAGEEVDVSADVDFSHEEPVPGVRYWYRYQAISSEAGLPGENPPSQSLGARGWGRHRPPLGGSVRNKIRAWQLMQQVGTRQVSLSDAILSDLSPPFPYRTGITYLEVPDLAAAAADPAHGDTGVPVDSIDFTWPAAVGADEYRLEVFASPVPTGTPVATRQVRFATSTHTETVSFSPDLAGSTQHSWRVGVRADNNPQINQDLASRRGWAYSQHNLFTTVPAPPPPP